MSPMWEAAGFRAPAPLLQAFEQSIRALPGALPLWPAPLFSISSGESIDMLKGGSESMSSSDMDRKKTNSTEEAAADANVLDADMANVHPK